MTTAPSHDTGDDAVRAALLASLNAQRRHVVGIVEGLSDDQLRATLLPSGWSLVGLVQHLALDVEHYWFSCIVGGESLEVVASGADDPNDAWKVAATTPCSEVLAAYRAKIDAANEVIASTPLEAPPKQRDGWWGEWDVPNLRFVMLHVITETACHAGHLDAARELIDGTQWVTL